jgi:octaprenyl-diphosphate synthase
VIGFVKKSGGLEYAETVMNSYYQEALEILKTFPDSVYKTSLADLVSYTIDRKK